ncbi:hypothetical protein WOLCODRAFT_157881 [Wolfiporia cocos MD-104 SS10]|uniref:Uncharacterized protein n=1 Tax=Wolfiporia cocos (strain MD-104) TaxID=742152 RepID=A0A2H3JHH9_WOLCO|nr:hypothetical protein WOLCODRAFT_157881 [Wolfiporia cocos MD-104 SS10]
MDEYPCLRSRTIISCQPCADMNRRRDGQMERRRAGLTAATRALTPAFSPVLVRLPCPPPGRTRRPSAAVARPKPALHPCEHVYVRDLQPAASACSSERNVRSTLDPYVRCATRRSPQNSDRRTDKREASSARVPCADADQKRPREYNVGRSRDRVERRRSGSTFADSTREHPQHPCAGILRAATRASNAQAPWSRPHNAHSNKEGHIPIFANAASARDSMSIYMRVDVRPVRVQSEARRTWPATAAGVSSRRAGRLAFRVFGYRLRGSTRTGTSMPALDGWAGELSSLAGSAVVCGCGQTLASG